MNGYISKNRWVIVIVAGALAAGLAYYSQQVEELVSVVAEKTETSVENVAPDESKVVTSDATDKVVVEEEQPSAEVVAPVEATQVEEVVTAAPEPESPPSEPDPVEVVEEDVVEAVVEEAIVEEVVVTEEPVVETTENEPVVEVTEEAVTEEPTPEASVEPATPEVIVETPTATEPEATDKGDAQTDEAAAVVEELTNTITAASDEEVTQEGIKPTFDVVRVDPTGSTVIAGTAEPYSKVVILSNGEDIGEAIAGSSGEFVAIIQVPDNEQGQTLELETEVDGQLLFSDETILILPIMRSAAADAIAEESASPIIRATAEEVVILQGAPKLALGQVSLDSISYDENDEVVLAGRGNPGRTIIIYVDDSPLMDTVVSDSGSWKQALHGLDAGRYVLRVDEIDDEGNVTSRVESPFQREYPEDVREAKAANDTTYTVQPGNSLWLIATGRYGDGMRYHQIFSANQDQIRNPDLIYPGQVFAIPDPQE
ncbi:MAG: LysM peptidoglycan-binding domain-containing protein [Rhodobacteraceae bacterium]|nr:LysM peptidoglycan-binding domain-containing protein [Paracoccaceae bacterium]